MGPALSRGSSPGQQGIEGLPFAAIGAQDQVERGFSAQRRVRRRTGPSARSSAPSLMLGVGLSSAAGAHHSLPPAPQSGIHCVPLRIPTGKSTSQGEEANDSAPVAGSNKRGPVERMSAQAAGASVAQDREAGLRTASAVFSRLLSLPS